MDDPAKAEPDRIGYLVNLGGLTNQKLALLGLFVKALQTKKTLVLPMMCVKDHVQKKNQKVPFRDVFEVEPLFQFAAEYGLVLVDDDPPEPESASWPYFASGAGSMAHLAIHRKVEEKISRFVFGFFDSLIPHIRKSSQLEKVFREVFEERNIEVAAQFRIESDWKLHSAVTLKPTVKNPEDFYLPFDGIVAKIVKTLPQTKKIFVFSDEAAMPNTKEEMNAISLEKFGVELFWKSDFLTADDLTPLNNLERSLLDFEIAKASKIYVGITRSTFSNMVTFEKFARSRDLVTTDYIYNNHLDELGLRTDNGGAVSPYAAVK